MSLLFFLITSNESQQHTLTNTKTSFTKKGFQMEAFFYSTVTLLARLRG